MRDGSLKNIKINRDVAQETNTRFEKIIESINSTSDKNIQMNTELEFVHVCILSWIIMEITVNYVSVEKNN